MIVKHEEVFGVDTMYFEGAESVEFMVRKDEQCLPPTTQKFSLTSN